MEKLQETIKLKNINIWCNDNICNFTFHLSSSGKPGEAGLEKKTIFCKM